MRSHFLRLTLACLWCWATLIPLRLQAIPLWVFAAGESAASSGTSPGTGNLLFWLDLETDGTDSSANGRNWTENGTISNPAGKVGNCAAIGDEEYLSIGDASWQSPQTPNGDITIAMWIKLTDATPAANAGILNKYSTASQRAILISQLTNGTTSVVLSDTGASADVNIASSGTRSDTTWFSLVVVFDASTSVRLYINGVQEAEDTTSIPADIHDSTSGMQLGVYSGGYAIGDYDSFCMYNKAWTTDEIAWFHNAGNGRQFSDL